MAVQIERFTKEQTDGPKNVMGYPEINIYQNKPKEKPTTPQKPRNQKY